MTSHLTWMHGVMLLAGLGIPVMAAMNGALGARIGAPGAATILFAIALCCAFVAVLATGGADLSKARGAAPLLYLGGAFVAFYVLSITMLGPKMGVATAVLFVLMGQLLSAAAIDHFGLFGAPRSPMSGVRWMGLGLMAVGIWFAKT